MSLFDGKTLNGWQGSTERYSVQDGKIVVDFGPKPFHGDGQLSTVGEYTDFVLRLEYTLSPAANNGILLRAPLTARTSKDAIEVQILDDSAVVWKGLPPSMRNASLSRIVAAKPGPVKPFGEWNSLEVEWKGRHVRVALNGAVRVDTDLDDPSDKDAESANHLGLKREKGHIVLHSYGSQGKVEFRNIRIRELTATEAK